jgi:hypothetical protein
MHESHSPSILLEGSNCGIGKEGWAAVGRALSSNKNLKTLYLGEERRNA